MTEELSTRDRIIQATAELMELHGYHGTGLNDIVKHSGAPKGSIYHYFPDGKVEIAAETIAMTNNHVYQNIEAALSAHDDAAEAVRETVLQVMTHFQEHQCKRSGMTSPMELASISDVIRNMLVRGMQDRRSLFEQKLILGGIAQEQSYQLSWIIIAAVTGAILLSRVHEHTEALEHVSEQLYNLIKSAMP